jgi:hypothetical protein
MKRTVQLELLDELPARDLRRLNLLMGHHRIMAKALSETFDERRSGVPAERRHHSENPSAALYRDAATPKKLAELGAGGGEFLLSVARQFNGRWQNLEATLVDRADVFDPPTRGEFSGLGWHVNVEVADALAWLRHSQARKLEVIVTNLFLHQFQDPDLGELLRLAANSAELLIAVEPRRGFWPLLCSRLVGLVGCGAVTRYDAPVSVRAGFRGLELSALWPDQKNWELTERRAGLFSHLFIARRKR